MPPPPPAPYGYPMAPPVYPAPAYAPPQAYYYPPAAYWPAPVRAYPVYAPPVAAPRAKAAPAPKSDDRHADDAQANAASQHGPASATAATSDQSVATSDRQQAFIERLLPIVVRENARLVQYRLRAQYLTGRADTAQLTNAERAELRELARRYRVDGNPVVEKSARDELLQRIDVIPVSLALAQAANESAWGTSRFAREGNNLFGIWTYDQNKGIVPKQRAVGKRHLVRRFDSLDDSVRYYLHTLNSHPAYQALREARAQARARGDRPRGRELASGLTGYSAKGEEYVRLIRQLIERYDLAAIAAQRDTG
jgi:Bax protein